MNIRVIEVVIKLLKEMLGTNPIDPNVMDTHILDRQRKLIAENSKINKAINKYLDAKDISQSKGETELEAIKQSIEELIGQKISEDEFSDLKENGFAKVTSLKETISELDEKGITCFFRDDENIAIGSHMILGFLKAASEAIGKTLPMKKKTILNSISYTQSILNQHTLITPDLIHASNDIVRTNNGKPEYKQRSLRAMTAQGPRISLAKSEILPVGTTFKFTINLLENSPLTINHLNEMFSYGEMTGLGQWRNAGYGRFEVVSIK